MSAYALPGLFPAVEEVYSSSAITNNLAASVSPTAATDCSFTSLASGKALASPVSTPTTTPTCKTMDEGVSSRKSFASRSSTNSISDLPGQCSTSSNKETTKSPLHASYAHLPPLKSLDDEADEQDGDSSSSSSSSMLGIAIMEAKIDPVRLVQYLTGKASTTQKNLRRRVPKPKERMAVNNGGGSPQGSPVGRTSIVDFASGSSSHNRVPSLNNNNTPKSTATSNSPHNEAIEFELSITFQGRKYTAKRTMQCMINLRDDLIREMNARRQWLTRQMPPLHPAATSDEASSSVRNNPQTFQTPSSIEIPEIPTLDFSASDSRSHDPSSSNPYSSRIGGMGFVGRGFTMLHAMVTSYAPVMDRWLKTVMAVVPQDSECLLNFLWEPSCDDNLERFGSILESSKDKSISMGSIKELDIEEEEEDA